MLRAALVFCLLASPMAFAQEDGDDVPCMIIVPPDIAEHLDTALFITNGPQGAVGYRCPVRGKLPGMHHQDHPPQDDDDAPISPKQPGENL